MGFLGKRTAISIIFATVLVAGAFLASDERESANLTVSDEVKKRASGNILEIDTDGDGLKDWEERLWNTDYKNPDTDGDGTPDGEEVSLGRDPLIPGPDDALDRYRMGLTSTSEFISDKELSATDALSRSFFSEYLGAKTSGITLSSSAKNDLAEEVIAGKIEDLNPTVYSLSSLNVSNVNTLSSLKLYASTLADALFKYAQDSESELAVLARALESNDSAELLKIDKIISKMDILISELITMSTPSSVSSRHLGFLNALSAVREDVSFMDEIFSDPIVGLLAITSYKKNSAEFVLSFNEIKAYIKSAGVLFESDEEAYSLFK